MSEPEFYANATLGFRRWCFRWKDYKDEPPSLEGLVRFGWWEHLRCSWDLRGPNRAECMHRKLKPGSFFEAHGEVPGTGCSCGFYAHGRRDASNSETMVHVVGGVVAGWGNVELHEEGFKCGVAKVLALFAPDPARGYADRGGVARKKWAALERMCAENDIPLLAPDALREDEEVRRYAYERDLALLEDQLSAFVQTR
ncbi:MAG: hypothetical protein ACRDTR_04925 [Rubrobacter sp.]